MALKSAWAHGERRTGTEPAAPSPFATTRLVDDVVEFERLVGAGEPLGPRGRPPPALLVDRQLSGVGEPAHPPVRPRVCEGAAATGGIHVPRRDGCAAAPEPGSVSSN